MPAQHALVKLMLVSSVICTVFVTGAFGQSKQQMSVEDMAAYDDADDAEYAEYYDPYAYADQLEMDMRMNEDEAAAGPAVYVTRFSFSPDVVDLRKDNRITFEASFIVPGGLYDPGNANTYFVPSQAVFQSATGNVLSAFFIPSQHLVEAEEVADAPTFSHGLEHDEQHFRTVMEIPVWNTANGVYQLAYLVLFDSQGHEAQFDAMTLQQGGYMNSFTVAGAQQDNDAPLLLDMFVELRHGEWRQQQARTWQPWFEPFTEEDLYHRSLWRHQVNVTVYLAVLEPTSGLAVSSSDLVQPSYIHFTCRDSPNTQSVMAHFGPDNFIHEDTPPPLHWVKKRYVESQIIAVNVTFPAFTWPGMWQLGELRLSDEAGNFVLWSSQDLERLNLPVDFYVHNANLSFHGDDIFDYKPANHEEVLELYQEYAAEAEEGGG